MQSVPSDFTLSVVVPIYNEERTLAALVNAVRAVPIRKQIILVDDCSKDGSRAIMESFADDDSNSFVKLQHDVNKGKTAASTKSASPTTAAHIRKASISARRTASAWCTLKYH